MDMKEIKRTFFLCGRSALSCVQLACLRSWPLFIAVTFVGMTFFMVVYLDFLDFLISLSPNADPVEEFLIMTSGAGLVLLAVNLLPRILFPTRDRDTRESD